jgi:hypothetical protein
VSFRQSLLSALFTVAALQAAEIKPATVHAFDEYIRKTEQRLEAQQSFVACDSDQARSGEVVVGPAHKQAQMRVPDGLIHDWLGCVFIPGVTLDETLALVQDYNRHKDVYRPEVIDSRLISRQGDDFKIYLRLLKKKVITVVLATEHTVRYTRIDGMRAKSRSYTTKITEVENAGKPDERELPPGKGHGFLWKLNSYWRFQERDNGTYVECEAVSLTRDVPTGLGWLIEPIIRNLPRESLANTLRSTRAALAR